MLFQLRRPGHPQDDTIPNFFPDSNSPMLGLSNEVSFVSEICQEDVKTTKVFSRKLAVNFQSSTTVVPFVNIDNLRYQVCIDQNGCPPVTTTITTTIFAITTITHQYY